jgi:hypothetical protein
MGQLGFFDLNRRYESLTEKKAKTAIYPAPSSAASRPARTAAGPSEWVKL